MLLPISEDWQMALSGRGGIKAIAGEVYIYMASSMPTDQRGVLLSADSFSDYYNQRPNRNVYYKSAGVAGSIVESYIDSYVSDELSSFKKTQQSKDLMLEDLEPPSVSKTQWTGFIEQIESDYKLLSVDEINKKYLKFESLVYAKLLGLKTSGKETDLIKRIKSRLDIQSD